MFCWERDAVHQRGDDIRQVPGGEGGARGGRAQGARGAARRAARRSRSKSPARAPGAPRARSPKPAPGSSGTPRLRGRRLVWLAPTGTSAVPSHLLEGRGCARPRPRAWTSTPAATARRPHRGCYRGPMGRDNWPTLQGGTTPPRPRTLAPTPPRSQAKREARTRRSNPPRATSRRPPVARPRADPLPVANCRGSSRAESDETFSSRYNVAITFSRSTSQLDARGAPV